MQFSKAVMILIFYWRSRYLFMLLTFTYLIIETMPTQISNSIANYVEIEIVQKVNKILYKITTCRVFNLGTVMLLLTFLTMKNPAPNFNLK